MTGISRTIPLMTGVYPTFQVEFQLASVLDQPRDRARRKTDGTGVDPDHLSRIRRVLFAATRTYLNLHQCDPSNALKPKLTLTAPAPLTVSFSNTSCTSRPGRRILIAFESIVFLKLTMPGTSITSVTISS